MTVKREIVERFYIAHEDITPSIQEVLDEGQSSYRYTNIVKIDKFVTSTTIKPKLWPLLSTEFEIRVIPDGPTCKVIAMTCSQSFLFGDIFGFYIGYIQDFLRKLRNRLANNPLQ